MLSFEAAVGVVFLKCGVWLPWAHRSLPFLVRPLLSSALSLPFPWPRSFFLPAQRIPPLQTTCLSFFPLDLCICCPLTQEDPFSLRQTSSRAVLIPGHLSMDLPRFPCTEPGWWNHPSSDTLVCYVIWACTLVSWDGWGIGVVPDQ